jgi:hypothetical protein
MCCCGNTGVLLALRFSSLSLCVCVCVCLCVCVCARARAFVGTTQCSRPRVAFYGYPAAMAESFSEEQLEEFSKVYRSYDSGNGMPGTKISCVRWRPCSLPSLRSFFLTPLRGQAGVSLHPV